MSRNPRKDRARYSDCTRQGSWTHSLLYAVDGTYLGWVWGTGAGRELDAFWWQLAGEDEDCYAETRAKAKRALRNAAGA